ncbi:MAG: transcriptional repressor LexA [Planctomycetes bacterium]|nr:transcriptional repressor LexA [Planctomycetota bacterium]
MGPPTNRPPTARQLRVVEFIRRFTAARGFPPTQAEIASGLQFRSVNAAVQHLRLLARKGVLSVEPGRARGIRLLASPYAAAEGAAETAAETAAADGARRLVLPLIGEVAAGVPLLAVEQHERRVEVDRALFSAPADFLLRVRGDSMIEAGIAPGDLVAVQKTASVRDGQIVVVRLDDEVTVKRWRVSGRGRARRVVLEPANARLQPIVVDPARTHVAIEGLVVGLVRPRLSVQRNPP